MKILKMILLLVLFLSIENVMSNTDADRISKLEQRVELLEGTLASLEPLLVARYGLIRQCEVPLVTNGEAKCPDKIEPGERCTLLCNPGYIPTPGKDHTRCKKGGFWSAEMQCEIPLLLVSGGATDQGDVTSELISFFPSKGCDLSMPDMPRPRNMHNIVYQAGSPGKVLACNGMTDNILASCDVLDLRTSNWTHHSYPNKARAMVDSFCDTSVSPPYECRLSPDRKKGRYAAQTMRVGEDTVIVGGMVYDDKGHDTSGSFRELSTLVFGGTSWDAKDDMSKRRAFFCSVNIKDGALLAIGGLGIDKKRQIIQKSVEHRRVGFRGTAGLKWISKFSDMRLPRSGLGCSAILGNDYSILVSGGTKGFGQPAIADAEIFDWKSNSWRNAASMKSSRFGHAVVAVGSKVFAVGGDERNPKNILDTIEEYDIKNNSWKMTKTKLKTPRSNFGYTLLPHSIFNGCVITWPLTE